MTKDSKRSPSAIMLIHCPDQKGLVAAVTDFISTNDGNILYLDQHVDAYNKIFFMRVEWDLNGFLIQDDDIGESFSAQIAEQYAMEWELYFSDDVPRMAIFVSKLPHCLYDILARWNAKEINVEIPLIISNHDKFQNFADQVGIDFHLFEINKDNKAELEKKQLELLREHDIDFIALARYMQILSGDFVDNYPNRIINIHHSFLPAFAGAKPYHAAYDRGVKVIGATSHYVTSELDAGPIIAQDVIRVSHLDSIKDLIRKGRDQEKIVLNRAIWNHLQRKTLVYENRTVVFA